jgi:hypothetical protein
MNTSPKDGYPADAARRNAYGAGEDTLRLIASLPAPSGLADRVQAGLRTTPQASPLLGWILMRGGSLRPAGDWMHSGMVRGAAAAAIVCVVAAGGWRIYSHVQPAPGANVVVMPVTIAPSTGGFAPAGAKRVPQTLQGPVLTHPVSGDTEIKVVENVPDSSKPSPGGIATKKKKAHSRTAPAPLQ